VRRHRWALGAALLSIGAGGEAYAQELVAVGIRGAVDPDSGRATVVQQRGRSAALDFGSVNPLMGRADNGELIPVRDGSGCYAVATLEVEVVDEASRLHAAPRLQAPAVPWALHRAGRGPAGRMSRHPLDATRLATVRPSSDLFGMPGAARTELWIRVEGVDLHQAQVRYASGTSLDWGASAQAGTTIDTLGTLIHSAWRMSEPLVHQLAVFLPGQVSGALHPRVVYEASRR